MPHSDTVIKRLKTIFTEKDIRRVKVYEHENKLDLSIDVHGLKCNQAKLFINNVINLTSVVSDIEQTCIIHGFHHGTAIRDMLAMDFKSIHVKEMLLDPWNPGMTHMIITA